MKVTCCKLSIVKVNAVTHREEGLYVGVLTEAGCMLAGYKQLLQLL